MKLPTILLINGLFMYQPAAVTPLASLADELRAAGFRVVVDNHLQTWHSDEDPVAVVGHSRGGWAAFQVQKRQAAKGREVPFVITLDAAPAGPCPFPGKCLNIHTDYYHRVPGAENLPISRYAGFPVMHSLIPRTDAAKRIILERLAPLANPVQTDDAQAVAEQRHDKDIGDMTITELIVRISKEPAPARTESGPHGHIMRR